ncbi:MAG: hypothetical protein M1829_002020 [Trizodia sp. TS-e1964]|nr:MAG: hypothetical protein M1829_002020 [Trizodia sp. TS-e1964]
MAQNRAAKRSSASVAPSHAKRLKIESSACPTRSTLQEAILIEDDNSDNESLDQETLLSELKSELSGISSSVQRARQRCLRQSNLRKKELDALIEKHHKAQRDDQLALNALCLLEREAQKRVEECLDSSRTPAACHENVKISPLPVSPAKSESDHGMGLGPFDVAPKAEQTPPASTTPTSQGSPVPCISTNKTSPKSSKLALLEFSKNFHTKPLDSPTTRDASPNEAVHDSIDPVEEEYEDYIENIERQSSLPIINYNSESVLPSRQIDEFPRASSDDSDDGDEVPIRRPRHHRRILSSRSRTQIVAPTPKSKYCRTKFTPKPIVMPSYILSLKTDFRKKLPLPETSVKFSRNFLSRFLGGGCQNSHLYVSDDKKSTQIYSISRYDAFCPRWNPQVPPKAGMHGACPKTGRWDEKPLFSRSSLNSRSASNSEIMEDQIKQLNDPIDVFVKRRPNEWEYCGKYIQGRRFEKLTAKEYEEQVPEYTRDSYATNLTCKQWGYDHLVQMGIARDIDHAQTFKPADIREMLDKPDDAPGIKIRFYWSYMECVGFDRELYDALCKKGMEIGWTTKEGAGFGTNAYMPTAAYTDEESDEDHAEDEPILRISTLTPDDPADGVDRKHTPLPEGHIVENPRGLYEVTPTPPPELKVKNGLLN